MVLLVLYESHYDPHKANFWWNTLNCCTRRCSLSEVQKDQKGKVEGHLSLARQQIEVRHTLFMPLSVATLCVYCYGIVGLQVADLIWHIH